MSFTTKSCMSEEKKKKILNGYDSIITELKRHRKIHKKEASKRIKDLTAPAWVRVNPAPSIGDSLNSYRLCMGFRNIGCKYRENDKKKLGCLNCGYYASTAFKEVDTETIIKQFKSGLKCGYKAAITFNSIEFLNDGSFLNNDEFKVETKERLMGLVARMPKVKRVLIESKPEYIEKVGVQELLDILREDQILEVGIGLESADDFIREKCINKGISKEVFEDSIAILSTLDSEYAQRLSIVVYILVKPAFLSQKESIDDIFSTLKYLSKVEERFNVTIIPKLEPAAIVNGTILSLLHQDHKSIFHYEPLNYWAILEILARVANDNDTKRFVSNIRIGAREDMDDILKVPAIYHESDECFHPFDFALYEAIQKFNQHHNIFRLLAIINEVFKEFNNIELYGDDSDLSKWLYENKILNSDIKEINRVCSQAINREKTNNDTIKDISLLKTIYAVLDIIEGYDQKKINLKNEINEAIKSKEIYKDKLEKIEGIIDKCFIEISQNSLFHIEVINMSKINHNYVELFFDVKELLQDVKVSIWSRVKFDR